MQTCFNWSKIATFPLLVLMTAGFNILCWKSSNNIFPSNVQSRNDLESIILYTIIGPKYSIDTFLDAVLCVLVKYMYAYVVTSPFMADCVTYWFTDFSFYVGICYRYGISWVYLVKSEMFCLDVWEQKFGLYFEPIALVLCYYDTITVSLHHLVMISVGSHPAYIKNIIWWHQGNLA